ncbi:Rho-GAP domain-containing protein [Balamuthia mandrillaris]
MSAGAPKNDCDYGTNGHVERHLCVEPNPPIRVRTSTELFFEDLKKGASLLIQNEEEENEENHATPSKTTAKTKEKDYYYHNCNHHNSDNDHNTLRRASKDEKTTKKNKKKKKKTQKKQKEKEEADAVAGSKLRRKGMLIPPLLVNMAAFGDSSLSAENLRSLEESYDLELPPRPPSVRETRRTRRNFPKKAETWDFRHTHIGTYGTDDDQGSEDEASSSADSTNGQGAGNKGWATRRRTPGVIFGVSLDDVMLLQPDRQSPPDVLVALLDGIVRSGGCETQGLFRVPGRADYMEELKQQLNNGDYRIKQGIDPHVVASVLKEWLARLSVPLIPPSLHQKCLAKVAEPTECIAMLNELPPYHKQTADYFISWLQRHSLRPETQALTRMDIRSTAMALAPCFFRTTGEDMEGMIAEIQMQIKFLVNVFMLHGVGSTTSQKASFHQLNAPDHTQLRGSTLRVRATTTNTHNQRKKQDASNLRKTFIRRPSFQLAVGDHGAKQQNEPTDNAAGQTTSDKTKEEEEDSSASSISGVSRFKKWQEKSRAKAQAAAKLRAERKEQVSQAAAEIKRHREENK